MDSSSSNSQDNENSGEESTKLPYLGFQKDDLQYSPFKNTPSLLTNKTNQKGDINNNKLINDIQKHL